jgi:preprotein translocase YajC subunit
MAPWKARTWISLCLCACFALGAIVGPLSHSNALASTFNSSSTQTSIAQDPATASPVGSATSGENRVQTPASTANSTLPGADETAAGLPDPERITTKPKPTLFEEILANPLLVASIMFAVLYLGVLLPAQRSTKRAQREQEEQVANLKKNDRVVTSFGVHGVVVSTQSDAKTVTIRIDESSNAKLTVNRDTIRVVKKD